MVLWFLFVTSVYVIHRFIAIVLVWMKSTFDGFICGVLKFIFSWSSTKDNTHDDNIVWIHAKWMKCMEMEANGKERNLVDYCLPVYKKKLLLCSSAVAKQTTFFVALFMFSSWFQHKFVLKAIKILFFFTFGFDFGLWK